MDIQMYEKYVVDPFERAELRMNPRMAEKCRRKFSGGVPQMRFQRNDMHAMNTMSMFPPKTPLAMAYVPFQQWEEPYDEETAFCAGTVFPSLDLPFLASGGACIE